MVDKQEDQYKEHSSSIVYVQDQDKDSPLSDMMKDLPGYITRGLLYLIVLFIAITLIWASINRIDIISTAQAVIIPEGKASVIQPDISGIVKRIAVKEGENVIKGQTVAIIESEKVGKSISDLKELEAEFSEAQKELGDLIPLKQKQLQNQINLLNDKLSNLLVRKKALNEKILTEQKDFEFKMQAHEISLNKQDDITNRLQMDITNAVATLELWNKELEAHRELTEAGLVSKIKLLEMQRSHAEAASQIGHKESLFQEAVKEREIIEKTFDSTTIQHKNLLNELKGQIDEVKFETISAHSETRQKRNEMTLISLEAEKRLDMAAFKLRQADELLFLNLRGVNPEVLKQAAKGEGFTTNLTIIKAPADGTISQLLIRNRGEAVTKGNTIMSLIPKMAALVAELKIPNKDIGMIKIGQKVKLKFDAFPFAEYGTISGTLINIMPDADIDAQSGLSYYRAISSLNQDFFRVKGERVKLLSGMTATAEIVTDKKTILKLILKPFTKLRKTKEAEE